MVAISGNRVAIGGYRAAIWNPRTAIRNDRAAIWNDRGPYGAFVAHMGHLWPIWTKMPRRFHKTVI